MARQAELATSFQRDHHRPPTPVEALRLAQQATLETRDAKHEPRSVMEQRTSWRREAAALLGERGIADIVASATSCDLRQTLVSEQWIDAAAAGMVATVEGSRATWQVWHLRAEASRRVRQHNLPPATSEALTAELMRRALGICQSIGPVGVDEVDQPAVLRRRDGSPMYDVAGSQLFTSKRIVAAEQRIIELAGRSDGRRVDEIHVSLALLASAANGVDLNDGQTNLVRQMATSGARVQLALAAAGSGKTTALKVLADAWREGGGEVLGLAPSAVAANILRDQVGNATTLAKLVWDLHHGPAGGASGIGPGTLVIVDEAGMADTISLAHVIDHVVGCGGSVRLIGDDQQLASVSAGGVLRDISRLHGAVELTELMRFSDRAEGAASLVLREGRPEALGYYLDEDRIHAGTRDSSVEAAFQGWATDLAEGRDSLMLAGTRESVAELNRRAREYRLTLSEAREGPEVLLGDGNRAGVGDVIVTRLNARQLRVSATDWVKNGDRWTIEQVNTAEIKARHRDSGLRVMLPAAYVADHAQLGYAVTVHTAQGLTVDTTHDALTGSESRQQLYVMMTRGRQANHVYVPVVGDGDEHAVLHPSSLRPETAVDVLESILFRDGAARSATTEHREATAPAARLADAAAQYLDGLHVAAESMLHPDVIQALDHDANEVMEGLTDCPAWPTLRSTLILNALDGRHPLNELRAAASAWELDSARDPAAMLTWRIHRPSGIGPLPWLPPIPEAMRDEPNWSRYLSICAGAVRRSSREFQQECQNPGRPIWALPGQQLTPALIGEVEVWRAAVGVDPSDRRATGRVQLGAVAWAWQKHLDDQL